MSNSKIHSTKRRPSRYIAIPIASSIAGSIVGLVLPILLISEGGPGGSFGIYSTPQEGIILILMVIAGVFAQSVAVVFLRKWFKVISIIPLVIGIAWLLMAIATS